MMLRLSLLFTLLICAQGLMPQDINFEHLGIKDGLSHPTVYSIYQDETGTMWFATRQGLNRYDGNTITTVSLSPITNSLISSSIRKIDGNKKGHIYLMTNNILIDKDILTGVSKILYNKQTNDFICDGDKIIALTPSEVIEINPVTEKISTITDFATNTGTKNTLLKLRNGGVAVGTDNGILIYDSKGILTGTKLPGNNITALFQSENNQIWAGTKSTGAFVSQPDDNWMPVSEIPFDVRCINQDATGNILIGTFNGLYVYNPLTNSTKRHVHSDTDIESLSHSSIYSLYRDTQQTIWIGTYFGGINYYNPQIQAFSFYSPQGVYGLSNEMLIIGNMTCDNDNTLWIATEGRGLFKINMTTWKSEQIIAGPNSLSHNNIKSVYFDKKTNKLFLGTHTGGVSVMNVRTGKFTYYSTNEQSDRRLPDNVVNKMTPYNRSLMLITQKGVVTIDMDSEKIVKSFMDEKPASAINRNIENIFIDSKGRAWMAKYSSGLIMFDLHTSTLKEYIWKPEDTNSFPRHRITKIYEDSKQRIIFATEGSGITIYNEETDNFNTFNSQNNNLIADYCLNLQSLPSGKLMVTSPIGFSIFDPTTHSSHNYYLKDISPMTGLIEENGLYADDNGRIYMAGLNGVITFSEKELQQPALNYNLYFSRLTVNNEIIEPGKQQGILDVDISVTKQIKLTHKQANITLTFASTNYIKYLHNEYEYQMKGLDDRWIQTNSKNLNFNNLLPGTYILTVRETTKGALHQPEARLEIVIKPPFYASIYAFIIYFILIWAIIYAIIIHFKSRANYQASLEIERNEKLQIEQLNQSKLRFFTNLSHEFRTPLTLILAHTDMMGRIQELSQPMAMHISKIKKNAVILRNLINELLDLRKQESGKLKLSCQQLNIVEFTRETYSSFKEYATIRNIRYQLEYPQDEIMVWFDPDQMHKVFFNLLSNAFKHTPEGGTITMALTLKTKSVIISIKDSGSGISPLEINKIFDPYYQAENMSPGNNAQLGTGIGLSLSKGIVEMHSGNISVDSTSDQGTTFRVELQLGDSHIPSSNKADQIRQDMIVDLTTIPFEHHNTVIQSLTKDISA